MNIKLLRRRKHKYKLWELTPKFIKTVWKQICAKDKKEERLKSSETREREKELTDMLCGVTEIFKRLKDK